MLGPTFQDLGALVQATEQLAVVKLLRDAIRVADLTGAAGRRGERQEDRFERREDHFCCDERFRHRKHIHPVPRYEERPVIHPTPRVELSPPIKEPDIAKPNPLPAGSPFQPPWHSIPWPTPSQPAQVIKTVQYRVDVAHKGSLLDLFI